MTDYRWLIFVSGSANNANTFVVPTSLFQTITNNTPYGYILMDWNNNWGNLQYTSPTEITVPRVGTMSSIAMSLLAIYGTN